MARQLRIEFPGALYHVTSRGNAKMPIVFDDEDRQTFLSVLGQTLKLHNVLCHAYCLMDNHYHLLLETPDANLSQTMRQVNGIYTQRFNRRHNQTGHVLQGRFKAIVVDRDSYLLELCRYIVLNPVRAFMVDHPEKHPWSSYRATAGLSPKPEFLFTDWILSQFGDTRNAAQEEYRRFVLAGIGTEFPWQHLKGQILLGGQEFVEKIVPHLKKENKLSEFPLAQRLLGRPSLKELFDKTVKDSKAQRNQAIAQAYIHYGYLQGKIADYLGLHYTTVSNIIRKELKRNH